MKKLGFTMAELIVTLGIIGVAATLCLVVIGDVVPDKNKIKVLDYYSALNAAIDDIFNDETLYHPYTIYDITTQQATRSCEGINCIANFDAELKSRLKINGTSGPKNSVWTFTKNAANNSYQISIDLDKNKTGCSYSSNCNAKQADTFILNVDEDGNVTAGDFLTEAYLNNPLKMNDRKNDIATAKTLLAKSTKTK